jgi:hypothetical protein
MRFWKKAPAVEGVNKDGEVVKVESKRVETIPEGNRKDKKDDEKSN